MAAVTNGLLKGDCEFSGFAIDSREVKKGDVFICIKGERVDGHDYVASAQANGAAGFLCARDLDTDLPYLKVEDPVAAFQQYAAWHKSQKKVLTVAVTGSVGKTTTKEFIYSALAARFSTHKTDGNKNSETGVAFTLIGINDSHEAAVVEMGMSGFGQIRELAKITAPDIAVITNIGYSHIEYLGSRENIMKAKLEIIEGLSENGVLIVNGDDDMLSTLRNVGHRLIRYGIGDETCDYVARDIHLGAGETEFTAVTPHGEVDIFIPSEGIHNVYNALAAVAVADIAGETPEEISRGLRNFKNAPLRQNIYEHCGVTIIEDCYNASPASMKSAFDILRMKQGRKIAVLGDMLELGAQSTALHREVGESMQGVDMLIAFGAHAQDYIIGATLAGVSDCCSCRTTSEAAQILTDRSRRGDVVLFKASRSMNAEKVIKEFIENRKDNEK